MNEKRKELMTADTVEVPCAFCKGKGKDQFELLSSLSTCQVCSGSGTRLLVLPIAKCAYCRGSGVHPHSRLVCMSCNGAGQVTVPADAIICPSCNGSGQESDHHFRDSVLSCNTCKGKGMVHPSMV